MIGANKPREHIPLLSKIAYAAPGGPLGALNFLTVTVLPTFYAKNTAVTLGAVGAVLLATRIFDAVFHPLIGFISDSLLYRVGRKPWVLAGGILCPVATYFLFTPAPTSDVTYFATWLILMFASWTILEIPHRAWGAEISRVQAQRSSIFAFLAQSKLVGSILFVAAPLLPFFASSDITSPIFLRWAGYAMAVALPLTAVLAVTGARSGARVAVKRSTLIGLFRSVARNRPFWIFAAVFAVSGIGSGLYNSVLLIYLNNFLGVGKLYPILGILYFAIALPMISVWSLIMNRVGKHIAWALGLGVLAFLLPFYWFVTPGAYAFPILFSFTVVFSISASASYLIPATMIGDIVDYDILKSHVNRSGNYYAMLQLIQTFEVAIGGGLGFIILGAFGYHAKGPNTELANMGLKLTLFILPAVLYAVSTLIVLRFPITMKRHDIIRRRIAQRATRLEQASSYE